MLTRRSLLATSGAALAAPSVARAAGSSVMKFIPQSDLTVLDPIWTTAYVTPQSRPDGVRHPLRHPMTPMPPSPRWWPATSSRATASNGA